MLDRASRAASPHASSAPSAAGPGCAADGGRGLRLPASGGLPFLIPGHAAAVARRAAWLLVAFGLAAACLGVGARGTVAAVAVSGPGGLIVIPRARGLAVVDPMTGEPTPLLIGGAASNATGVAWSPLARRLAVSVQQRQVGERFGGGDIVVLDSTGIPESSVDRDQPDVVLDAPAWLPSGEVVYARQVVGTPDADARVEASLPDGSARRLLASSARLPGVSPDGSRLAYLQPGPSGGQLVSLDLTTGSLTRLVDAASLGYAYFGAPRFSPDGHRIAFGASGGPAGPGTFSRLGLIAAPRVHGPNWDLWVMNAVGSGLRQATIIPEGDDLNAAWSPDGQWLAAYGPPGLYLVPAFTPGPTTPIAGGGSGEPDWLTSF